MKRERLLLWCGLLCYVLVLALACSPSTPASPVSKVTPSASIPMDRRAFTDLERKPATSTGATHTLMRVGSLQAYAGNGKA